MQVELVHRVPGRARVRISGLRSEAVQRNWVEKLLSSCPEISRFRINSWCETVVLETECQAGGAIDAAIGILRTTVISSGVPERKPARALVRMASVPFRLALRPTPLACATVALGLAQFGGPAVAALSVPLIAFAAFRSLRRACQVLLSERRTNVDSLDAVAVTVSVARGHYFTAAFISWMIALGDWIRDRTARQSRKAVRELLEFQAALAWVITESGIARVASSSVLIGQHVIVYPGEMIPVDGRVLRGQATVDQRIVTGESNPADKGPGDTVYASTVVQDGRLIVATMRVGDQTTAAQIVKLVDAAPQGETRIQNHAERLGDRLVAPALLLSGGLFAVTGNLDRLMSMLIVDYGTGIRVAAPTSVLAAMAYAARQGVLIKSGRHMEQLAALHTVVFDKTGTLTYGRPEIGDIVSLDERAFPPREIIRLAAGAEARLNHPISGAMAARASRESIAVPERTAWQFRVGMGVQAHVNGLEIHVGNERFLSHSGIDLDGAPRYIREMNRQGWSALLFAVDGAVKGIIPYADELRKESAAVIKELRNLGVRKVVMITGDNAAVAGAVGAKLGMDAVFADSLPSEKVQIVQNLQRSGEAVAMIGDGINDSPALAYADVGVSMKHGADVAREAADVVLMEDSLWKLVSAIHISRNAMKTIRQNYAIIASMNTVAMGLAIPAGLIGPNISALISNGSAVIASLNAIRPVLSR